MTPDLKTLADFKRFLADPRARIQIVENVNIDRATPGIRQDYIDRGMYKVRQIKKLQSNAVALQNPIDSEKPPSWLYWDGGTKGWIFSGDLVTIPSKIRPEEYIRYRCSFADDLAA